METVETHDITDASEDEIDDLLGYDRDENEDDDTKERWSPEHIRVYTKSRKRKGYSHLELYKRIRYHCEQNGLDFNEARKDALWEAFHGSPKPKGVTATKSRPTSVGMKR